jgi:hypothetical protein
MSWRFLFLLGVVILASCAPDPRNQADAARIQKIAEQESLDREQLRAQRAISFQQAQAERDQTRSARVAVKNGLYLAGGLALAIVILALAAGIAWGVIGAGRATARAAELRSCLIPLDEPTRQFPLLVGYRGHGRFSLINANTGAVLLLDSSMTADRQLITTAGAVQLAGVAAREARRAKDAGAVILATEGSNHGK